MWECAYECVRDTVRYFSVCFLSGDDGRRVRDKEQKKGVEVRYVNTKWAIGETVRRATLSGVFSQDVK